MKIKILIIFLFLAISTFAYAGECAYYEFKIFQNVKTGDYQTQMRFRSGDFIIIGWHKIILPDVNYSDLDSIKAGVKDAEKYQKLQYDECLREQSQKNI